MSVDELAATESRRLSREADRAEVPTLEAQFEPASGKGTPVTKTVTVRVDAAAPPALDDILRFSQEPAFHESIIMGPSAYRLIAGGGTTDLRTTERPERFVVNPGGPGHEKVSIDREALAAVIARDRPAEMARARRLLKAEYSDRKADLSLEERIALFEERWHADATYLRIDAAASRISSRALLLILGQDHVALWVRKEDLTVGPGRILGSVLAAAIVRPPHRKTRSDIVVPGGLGPSGYQYLQSTFGTGPERTLILDIARVRKLIAGIPAGTSRDTALALFERLAERSIALGRDREARAQPRVARKRQACG